MVMVVDDGVDGGGGVDGAGRAVFAKVDTWQSVALIDEAKDLRREEEEKRGGGG